MREKKAKSAAGERLQGSQKRLERALREGSFDGGKLSVENVRLGRRMARAERAFLLRLGPAHGAAHRQYLSHPELLGCHPDII
jgi:hypothetical protein